MNTIASAEVLFFLLVTFGLRTLLHWRATGSTGYVGVRADASPLERAAGALLGISLAAAPFAPWIGAPLWTFGRPVGAAIALAGTALTFTAQLHLGASWRIGVDGADRTALVTGGVFAIVRNPIFTAMILAAVGLALAAPTPLALALPIALTIALEVQVRLVEEPYLRRVHGDAYLRWARTTGRFLPGLGRLDR